MSITQHDWILIRSQFIFLRLLNIALISCRKILMCAFVVAAATTTAAATISIVNGSFEADVFNAARDGSSLDLGGTNLLTGWTTLHNGIYPWGLQNTNGYRAGPTPYGNQWVVVGDYGHGGTWIQQAVTGFTIGKTYELSFALATEQGRGALAEVSFPTGSNTPAQVFTAPLRVTTYWDKWGTFTMPFIATDSTVTIRFTGLAGPGFDVGIDNVNIKSPDINLRAGLGSDSNSPTAETTGLTDVIKTANVPLGGVFFIQLVDNHTGTTTPINGSFTLGSSIITPAIAEPTLFPNNVVIPFANGASNNIIVFQAVHLGEVSLTIIPTDTLISPVQVKIKVNNPASLGNNHTDVDNALNNYGHLRGIPPHLLKGQVRQESGPQFDPLAYRYEPLSADLAYISKVQDLRIVDPYRFYRLATADGLANGTGILVDDISPRSIYDIIRDKVLRQIVDTDTLVSAQEIYEENDDVQNWSNASPQRAARIAANPSLLNFTAQTPLAASYGYLQIMYSTAIAPMHWTGDTNGDRNPSFLFDTDKNRQNNGGSLALGSAYLRRLYSTANKNISLSNPNINNAIAFERTFQRMFQGYNSDPTYAPKVIDFSRSYLPVTSGTIFQ